MASSSTRPTWKSAWHRAVPSMPSSQLTGSGDRFARHQLHVLCTSTSWPKCKNYRCERTNARHANPLDSSEKKAHPPRCTHTATPSCSARWRAQSRSYSCSWRKQRTDPTARPQGRGAFVVRGAMMARSQAPSIAARRTPGDSCSFERSAVPRRIKFADRTPHERLR
jgi:hypothetical protein